MIESLNQTEQDSLLKRLMTDTPFFDKLLLPHMFYTKIPEIHKDVYRNMNRPDIKILLMILPRGWAKTTICQGFLTQSIVNVKHQVILYVADVIKQAMLHTDTVRRELEVNERIIELYGEQKSKSPWGSEMFTTRNGVTVFPKGSNQSIRGIKVGNARPSLLILDDMENDENSMTQDQRDKLWRTLFSVLLPILDSRGQGKDTKIIYLGTPIHEDCVLLRLLKLITELRKEGRKDLLAIKYSCEDEDGNSTWPELWPNERLAKTKALFAKGNQLDAFYREFKGEVIAGEKAAFKPKDTVFYPKHVPSPDISKLSVYAAVDVAISQAKSSDFSAVTIVGFGTNPKRCYILEAIRDRMTPKEFYDLLISLNDMYRPIKMFVQRVALDEFFTYFARELMQNEMFMPFEKVKLSRMDDAKKRRIGSLQPLHLTGQLVLNERFTDLLAELYSYPRAAHDDLSDALATITQNVWTPVNLAEESKKEYDPVYSYESISAEMKRKWTKGYVGGVSGKSQPVGYSTEYLH